MQPSLVDTFINDGALSLANVAYTQDDIKQSISKIKDLFSELKEHTHCFILEENPLIFSLTFLQALDSNLIPISLDPHMAEKQRENLMSFEANLIQDGKVLKRSTKIAPFQNCYGCMTSGTTSTPKLCYLSIEGAKANALAHSGALQVDKNSLLVQTLPLYHSFGIIAYLFSKIVRQCALDFNPTLLPLKEIQARNYKEAIVHTTPSQVKFLLKEKISDVLGIKSLSFGAGLVDTESVLQIKEKLIETKTYVTYGLTEAGPRVTSCEVNEVKEKGFIGKALKQTELKVCVNNDLKNEGEGFLAINSPSLLLNLKDHPNQEGYLVTRDQVLLKNGEVYYLGRESDLIKVSGISVYPSDIEHEAKKLEEIEDAIVLSKPHSLYGEVPVLFVEGKIEKEHLQTHLKSHLTQAQMPKKIHILDKLPRKSLQKVDRQKLRELL